MSPNRNHPKAEPALPWQTSFSFATVNHTHAELGNTFHESLTAKFGKACLTGYWIIAGSSALTTLAIAAAPRSLKWTESAK